MFVCVWVGVGVSVGVGVYNPYVSETDMQNYAKQNKAKQNYM